MTLRPLIEGLERSLVESAWAGYSGAALDYSGAVAAMRRNPLWGVNLDNVLSWGRREALEVAATDLAALEPEVRGLLEEAVREGWTLDRWREGLDAALEGAGLAGPEPWHAEAIFRTNVLAAYSGGQWTRAQDLAARGDVVAAMYVAVLDDRTRATHGAMDGVWARLDDPVWLTWWPPNGWNCRCGILLLTQADVDRLGGWEAAPQAPAVSPDPGFDGNPGLGLWRAVGLHMTA